MGAISLSKAYGTLRSSASHRSQQLLEIWIDLYSKKKAALDHVFIIGSSPSRVGNFDRISYRIEHAGEDFEAQVLLIAEAVLRR